MARLQTPAHLKREFECVYLIRHDVEDPAVDKLVGKYRALVDDNGGKVVHLESWGRRKLAYPINKQRTANYIHMQFFGTRDMVRELERSMRITEEVVRFLTVLLDRQADPEAKPAAGDLVRRQEPEAETEGRIGEPPARPERQAAPSERREEKEKTEGRE